MHQVINARLFMIYVIVFVGVLQEGVELQMEMFMYYPTKYHCITPVKNYSSVTKNQCFYQRDNASYPCNKWTFHDRQIKSTVISEMQLVCQYRYLQLLIVPVLNLVGIGTVSIGVLSDILGRKYMFIFTVIIDKLLSLIVGIIPTNYTAHVVIMATKSIVGWSTSVGLVIVSELTPLKYRNILAINYWAMYGVGRAIGPVYMWATSEWRSAWLLSLWPCVIFLFSPFFLLETPKWLLVNNRRDDAKEVLKKLNQFEDEDDFDEFMKDKEISEVNHSVWNEVKDYFRSPILVVRLTSLMFISLAFSVFYLGVATNVTFTNDNIYLNAALMGLVEVPAGMTAYLLYRSIGGVHSVIVSITIATVSYVISPIIWQPSLVANTAAKIVHMILMCISDFFIINAWNVQNYFFMTLIPTNLRNTFMSVGLVVESVGSALGDYIGYYFVRHANVANGIYYILIVLSAIFAGIFIPRRDPNELPNTVEDCKKMPNNFKCLNGKNI